LATGQPHHSHAHSNTSNRLIDSCLDDTGDDNEPPLVLQQLLSLPHGAHDVDKELEAAAEEPKLYSFDQLLDEEPLGGNNMDATDQLIFNEHHMYDDRIDNRELDQQNLENTMYDVDFSLPEGREDLPTNEHQVFQYPMEDEPDHPPDDDLEDEDNLRAHYAAFEEPDLICNVYINAYVQKTLYSATHCALRHQLKAVHQTLASHLNIAPEALDKMAQSITTVE
jgi:hypothetical protein